MILFVVLICETKGAKPRTYQLNTQNIVHNASRSGDMCTLKGKVDSTGGRISMYINATNGKGTIKYYNPSGTEFGKGNARCLRKN